MKAIITAGGNGTRLRPITYSMNKHLIPVGNQPIIFNALDDVAKAGITEVLININKGDKELPKAVGDGARWKIKITYQEQDEPRGLGHLLKLAKDFVGNDKFVFYYGDNIFTGGLKEHLQEWEKKNSNFHLCLVKVKDPEGFGVAVVENDKIVKTVEKPQTFISDLAITGIQFYDAHIFEALEHVRPTPPKAGRKIAEMDIPPANQWLLDNGYTASYSIINGWWKDTGKPYDLLAGNRLLLQGRKNMKNLAEKIEETVDVQGDAEIAGGVQLLGKTVVRGPVAIGENSIIRDSYIGPYSAIGKNVEIYNSEVENSIIMDDADISCEKRIVDSIIGHNATIASAHLTKPAGHRLIIGENSQVEL